MIITYADVASRVLAAPARLGPVRMVAVDGPAGAGKSTFAGRLAAALKAAGVRVAEVHTDDLLEGWTDIVSFWPRLESGVLAPLRRGEPGVYRPYDWTARRFADEECPVPVADVLVLEGVTSGRAQVRPELTLLVWVEAPRDVRLARGIERDGEALRPQWLRWMADEDAHFALDRAAERAHVRVNAAPDGLPHDPYAQFVGDISGWTRLTG